MISYFFAARIDLKDGRTVYSDGIKQVERTLDLEELRREIAERASKSAAVRIGGDQVALTCLSRLIG